MNFAVSCGIKEKETYVHPVTASAPMIDPVPAQYFLWDFRGV